MNNALYSSEYNTALAIVGMAGRFPGASSLEHFWQNLANKVSAIRQYSAEELLAAGVSSEDLAQPNYVRAGAVLENIENFDASFFGFSPREAEVLDPQFRIFLECVWEAVEMAGYDITTFSGLIGIFAGSGYKNYLLHHLKATPELSQSMSEFQMSLGQEMDVLATLISYKLNLKGPSVSVQSFCSTSLVGVHLACQSLLNYECDLAVAGGVALNSLQKKGYFYEEGKIVSPDGFCRPFDARAQGSVLSNGAAVVALKRLQDALADGDHIAAIIRGSAMNNDGSQRVSYTAPGLDGQASVIASALSYAGIHPETIGYLETNGTGTRLGDAIEIAAMTKAFASKTQKKRFCAISSLKPNVGHLDRASGAAGVIKTILAMDHGQLPPQLHYEQPSPEMDIRNSPFYINTKLAPWPRLQTPRRAGINSFGLGGTNVHLVLEEGPKRESGSARRSWQLFPLSAKSAWSLQQANSNLVAHLKAYPEQSLADVAYTLQIGRCAFNYRQCILARTAEEACVALEQQQELFTDQEHRDRTVTFVFSSTVSLEMAQNLSRQEPQFREAVAQCCHFLQTHLKQDLQALLLPEQADEFVTEILQPELKHLTLFIVEYALARLLIEWHICPQALFGIGTGEYVAACLAGVFSLEDALTLVAHQSQLMVEPDTKAESRFSVTSLAGDVSLRSWLSTIQLHAPQIPCLSPMSGTWLTTEQATSPAYWMQQTNQPVFEARDIELLLQDQARVLLEVGTGEVLSSLVKQHPAYSPEQHAPIISLSPLHSDQASLLVAVGHLWLAGVTIDWKCLAAQEQRLRVVLPTYAFERQRYWIDDPANRSTVRRNFTVPTKEADRANWYVLPYWLPTLPPPLPNKKQHAKHCCLVFVDPCGIGERVAQRLEQEECTIIRVEVGKAFAQHSENGFTVRPDVSDDYRALFKELGNVGHIPNSLLHCWSVTTDEAIPSLLAYFQERQAQGFSSLLCLAKAIGQSFPDAPMHLIVLSNHIQAVTGMEFLRPEKAPIVGACKVLNQEYPMLTCQSIDLAGVETLNWANTHLIEDLAAECLTSPLKIRELNDLQNLTVAYQGHTRWVQGYAPVRVEQPATLVLRNKGVYLLIGGLGEIGLLLAEHLATMQARLVFVDSSPFPANEEWSTWLANHSQDEHVSGIIRRLQKLERLGAQVQVSQANLADAEQIQQIVEQIQQSDSLRGVLLLAGNAELQIIQDIEQADYAAYFQQVQGLFALAQALQGITLDFCLLCSSLAGVWGDPGCVVDAATSQFLHTFAYKQSQTSTTPWISVSWDHWQTSANEQPFFSPTASTYVMTPEEGVDVFSRIISCRWPNIIASTGNIHARFLQWLQAKAEIVVHAGSTGQHPRRPKLSTAYVPPSNPTEQKIVEIWQLLLGFEQIGIHDNFFQLHGHSLLGMQLISRLRQMFQVNIPLIKLFEGPTVAELASLIEAMIIEEIEQLDEEEAKLLI
ncbi:MAG: beta-ketoacyl synthase N-terminal-like domain-containing protein [Ktedonobacteraceae bacterium]